MRQPIWQKKNTMIQGNFYERLHFSMDSYATSPMASLFSIAFMFIPIYPRLEGNVTSPPRNEKVGFWVKVTFWFWLMYALSPEIEIGLNMNAIEKKLFQVRSASAFHSLPPTPQPHHHLCILFYA